MKRNEHPEFIKIATRISSLSKELEEEFSKLEKAFPTPKGVTWGLSAAHTVRKWTYDSEDDDDDE